MKTLTVQLHNVQVRRQALRAIPGWAGVIMLCPPNLRWYWHNEVRRWRPDFRPVVLEGRGAFRWPEPTECIILSYSSLWNPEAEGYLTNSFPLGPYYLIAEDEAHMYKTSKRARNLFIL